MAYLFSSESVSEGHPDKVADQISDALLDQFLAYDDKARCAIESFVTTGQVVIMGEVRSDVYIDLETIARNTINRIGYTKSEYKFDGDSCGVMTAIHEQSGDINRGVDKAEDDEQHDGQGSGGKTPEREFHVNHSFGNSGFDDESLNRARRKIMREFWLSLTIDGETAAH